LRAEPSFAAGRDGVRPSRSPYPVEEINHVHTPGNSSGIVDGASLLTIGNAKTGDALGLTPRARILAAAVSGADPTIMLTGPGRRRQALAKADDDRPDRPVRDQ
jgi:acetyl-CoA C-acetyltransferase